MITPVPSLQPLSLFFSLIYCISPCLRSSFLTSFVPFSRISMQTYSIRDSSSEPPPLFLLFHILSSSLTFGCLSFSGSSNMPRFPSSCVLLMTSFIYPRHFHISVHTPTCLPHFISLPSCVPLCFSYFTLPPFLPLITKPPLYSSLCRSRTPCS